MHTRLIAPLALVLVGGFAQAADLPRRDAVPVAPIVVPFSWTGFYVGVNAGYHFGASNSVNVTTDPTVLGPANAGLGIVPGSLSPDRDGFTAGGQIGYNFQINPSLVVGIEADFNYVDGEDTASFNLGTTQPNLYSVSHGFEWFATLRGRVGFVPIDRLMIFATGGLAVADITRTATHTNGGLGVFTTASNSDVEAGFTIGAGAEYAFTNNLTFKAEYLYYSFDRTDVTLLYPAPVAGGTANNRFETDGHIVRLGVNYKF